MKISDILSIDSQTLRTMDIEQLERIVKEAGRYSERRLKNIETKGLTLVSPAYQAYADQIRAPGGRGRNGRFRLIYELRLRQRFLGTQTSTVKNARSYRKRMQKLLPNVREEDYTRFWAAVNAIKRTNALRYGRIGSGSVVAALQAAWDASKSKEETDNEFIELFEQEWRKSNERWNATAIPDPTKFRDPLWE